MSVAMRTRSLFFALGGVAVGLVLLYLYLGTTHRRNQRNDDLFSINLEGFDRLVSSVCLGSREKPLNIENLADLLNVWRQSGRKVPRCREAYALFDAFYSVSKRGGKVLLPKEFIPKVRSWLGGNEELLKEVGYQSVTTIFNRFTHESSIFTPFRAKRPGSGEVSPEVEDYVKELHESTKANCDFCKYKTMTANDDFPRIESKFSASASNTFKYEGYHALIIPYAHHPTAVREEQFADMVGTTIKWFKTVYARDPEFKYPHMNWDALPKASASQMHPHMQIAMNPVRYYGHMEHMRIVAQQYARNNEGRNYFTDLVKVHAALGLSATIGSAVAIGYLTPKKEHEVMILSSKFGPDFVKLFYRVLKAMHDRKMYAFSSATVFPSMGNFSNPSSDDLPVMTRILSRGGAASPRSDISSMELFDASNVFTDPWKVMEHVRDSLKQIEG